MVVSVRVCLRGIVLLAVFVSLSLPVAAQQRPMTFTDVMQFRDVEGVMMSDDGSFVGFTAEPDRGDPEAVVQATDGRARYVIPFGSHVQLSAEGRYAAVRLNPSLEAMEAAKKDGDKAEDKPKTGFVLIETATGDTTQVPSVDRFAFSHDGAWLAYLHHKSKADTTVADTTRADPAVADTTQTKKKKDKRTEGATLILRRLATGDTMQVLHVSTFAFDEVGRAIAYGVAAPDSLRDGFYLRDLQAAPGTERALDRRPHGAYSHLTWREDADDLAFLVAEEDAEGEAGPATLWLWNGEAASAVEPSVLPEGQMIPAKDNTLAWTEDGARLFFGLRPEKEEEEEAEEDTTAVFDPYDMEAILEDRTVDVWHWDDPLINTNQREEWEDEQKKTHRAVLHRASGRVVALGSDTLDAVRTPENAEVILGTSNEPYQKERTWVGRMNDLYVISLDDGTPTRIAERLSNGAPSLSPDGRYVAFYDDGDWHLYDVQSGTTRNMTAGLGVPFANEDHDYPSEAPGYGLGGWVENDAAVLVYDKYDIWQVPTAGGAPFRITRGDGREEKRQYRVIRTDRDQRFFTSGEPLLLRGYHDLRKSDGFYRAHIGKEGLAPLQVAEKRYKFVAKAEDADVLLFTQEDYDEFPDLWVTGPDFEAPKKITEVNPQMSEIAWGDSELIEWNSLDGIPLQGVVIKPENYDPSRRYPVVVYFYRFFSQRLHEFFQPEVNHRPVFPLYASDDYVLFLPDVRFEVGRPGLSATKSVVPGVQKLIDLGIADPDAIGLHGHSWSGYQAAFIVTQSNIFTAAIAGAPVSNMTSAYSGIRWGSGLARQFQYEMGQSRLGGSLWSARDRYIDNSPVFFADRVETPLLIIFGDEDGAVPWYQGIELYLALRRLEKPAWFLQYRGEDHHPKAYPNKLDWSMKMKEFFDHYLKGTPAPGWVEEGVPYEGE